MEKAPPFTRLRRDGHVATPKIITKLACWTKDDTPHTTDPLHLNSREDLSKSIIIEGFTLDQCSKLKQNMGKQNSISPQSVREKIEEGARGIFCSVMDAGRSAQNNVESSDQRDSHHVSLESVIRIMFNSCTAASPVNEEEPPTQEADMRAPEAKGEEPSPEPKKVDTERLYRELFNDSHLRAEEAVSHLREHLAQERKISPSKRRSDLPSMFPASSPLRNPVHPPKSIAETSIHDLSYDDGISVITQKTLDEIEKEREHSEIQRVFSDVTQDPIEQVDEAWKQTIPAPTRSSPSPLRFGRSNRSLGTTNTKRSYGTKSLGTKSTQSTQTHEFATVWQQEEQKYWDDVVKEQEFSPFEALTEGQEMSIFRTKETSRKTRHVSPSDRDEMSKVSRQSKRTVATVHSTILSSRASHPEWSHSAANRDPDRLINVLIMPPGTELGEI